MRVKVAKASEPRPTAQRARCTCRCCRGSSRGAWCARGHGTCGRRRRPTRWRRRWSTTRTRSARCTMSRRRRRRHARASGGPPTDTVGQIPPLSPNLRENRTADTATLCHTLQASQTSIRPPETFYLRSALFRERLHDTCPMRERAGGVSGDVLCRDHTLGRRDSKLIIFLHLTRVVLYRDRTDAPKLSQITVRPEVAGPSRGAHAGRLSARLQAPSTRPRAARIVPQSDRGHR